MVERSLTLSQIPDFLSLKPKDVLSKIMAPRSPQIGRAAYRRRQQPRLSAIWLLPVTFTILRPSNCFQLAQNHNPCTDRCVRAGVAANSEDNPASRSRYSGHRAETTGTVCRPLPHYNTLTAVCHRSAYFKSLHSANSVACIIGRCACFIRPVFSINLRFAMPLIIAPTAL